MSSPAQADAAQTARRFCDEEFPGATTILLGGSSSTGRRTATSDVDILLIGPPDLFENAGGDAESVARVAHRDGERIDVFAYTVDGFRRWSERDFASLRPVLPYLLTEGVPLRAGDEFEPLHAWCATRLAEGPRPSDHALVLRRYALTDLLDDLVDATDPLIVAAIRADVVRGLAELALLTANAWLGSGKWLARRVRAADPDAARVIQAFAAEPSSAESVRIASALLDRLGGRVDTDLVR